MRLFIVTDKEIIERICGSCNCDEATAKEYLNDEIRHLRELQEVNDHCKRVTLNSLAVVSASKPSVWSISQWY